MAPVVVTLAAAATASPSPSGTVIFTPPPADPIQSIGAVVAIVLALVAAVLGYRIIRGGRGL
ncbi:MAG TPA: hypothetical protein VFK89_12100 [Actinomycetota bacterium]|nr:hypothetical protein [Actinomycetota bacterium]